MNVKKLMSHVENLVTKPSQEKKPSTGAKYESLFKKVDVPSRSMDDLFSEVHHEEV